MRADPHTASLRTPHGARLTGCPLLACALRSAGADALVTSACTRACITALARLVAFASRASLAASSWDDRVASEACSESEKRENSPSAVCLRAATSGWKEKKSGAPRRWSTAKRGGAHM